MYNEATLWRNKFNSLKVEHEKTMSTLEESLKQVMKLIEIENVIRVNEFSDELKIRLIQNIIRKEV